MEPVSGKLDIWLSIVGGIIITLTLAIALLVLTSDTGSRFDEPFPEVTEEVQEGSVSW